MKKDEELKKREGLAKGKKTQDRKRKKGNRKRRKRWRGGLMWADKT